MQKNREEKQSFIKRFTGRISSEIAERRFIKEPSVENFLKVPADQRRGLLQDIEESMKYNIIKNLPESEKEKYVRELSNEILKFDIIFTMPANVRGQYINELTDEKDQVEIILTLPEEERGRYIDQLTDKSKLEVVLSLSDSKKVLYINELANESKLELVMSLPDDKRGLYIEELSDEDKEKVLISLPEKERGICVSKLLEEGKIDFILQLPKETGILLTKSLPYINEIYVKNNELFNDDIDLRLLLDKKYIETLGKDKVSLIACYPLVQKDILNLTDKELEILGMCLDNYTEKGNTEEWTVIANSILRNMSQYEELIGNIEDVEKVDITTLSKILQDKNVFNIKKVSEINLDEYETIKAEKTDEWIKSDDIETKKLAVFQKVFGHSTEFAKDVLGRFGDDIDNLPDSQMKCYVQSLQEILASDDIEILDKIYVECKETTFVDKTLVERQLKNEYTKLFNDGLLNIKDTKELPEYGEGIYSAGTDFQMIITSVGYVIEGEQENYKEDWNRHSISSQHMCTSYIRNDMLGTGNIPHFCYGFNDMEEDSLMMSGPHDLASSIIGELVPQAYSSDYEKYLTPNTQINNTESIYNEMDWRRIQNGTKKQPSYIVVFKKDGQIDNIEEAKKAQEDWGKNESGDFNIPIVVVDINECLKEESKKVDDLFLEYKKNPSKEIAEELYYKIKNNRITTSRWGKEEFRNEIDLEIIKEMFEDEIMVNKEVGRKETIEKAVTEQDMIENYSKISAKDRKLGVEKFRKILKEVQEIKRGDTDNGERE